MIDGVLWRLGSCLAPCSGRFCVLFNHVHEVEDVVCALVDFLPDEFVGIRGRSRITASATYKRLSMLGGVARNLARRVSDEEFVEGHDSCLAVDGSEGVDVPRGGYV